MFVMATGSLPFQGDSLQRILEQHRSAKPADPRELRPDLPQAFSEAILRCLEKDPERRYASVAELRQTLEGIASRC